MTSSSKSPGGIRISGFCSFRGRASGIRILASKGLGNWFRTFGIGFGCFFAADLWLPGFRIGLLGLGHFKVFRGFGLVWVENCSLDFRGVGHLSFQTANFHNLKCTRRRGKRAPIMPSSELYCTSCATRTHLYVWVCICIRIYLYIGICT